MYKRYRGPPPVHLSPGSTTTLCGSPKKDRRAPFHWHNREWVALWQSWVDYQKATKGYGESPDIDLVREVELDR